jgi:hypothetical protein
LTLTKLDSLRSSTNNNQVIEHSRDLLGIVFARTFTSASLLNSSASFDRLDESFTSSVPKVLTFAMRHRAFCAASILCPREALERVAEEVGLLCKADSKTRTLRACAFGSFVAKEIEELGLSLPHSDLGLLSSMHFPSYARTLRRDHRDIKWKGSDGRLLLLMIEMSLRGETIDASFIEALIDEMVRLQLPRTLLLTVERLCSHRGRSAGMRSLLSGKSFEKALSTLSNSVLSELRRLVCEKHADDNVVKAARATVSRLGGIVVTMRSLESDWFPRTRYELASLLPSVMDIDLLRSISSVITHLDRQTPTAVGTMLTKSDSIECVSDALCELESALATV